MLTNPYGSLHSATLFLRGFHSTAAISCGKLTIEGNGEDVAISSYVPGALMGVTLDGERIGSIVFDPYTIRIPALTKEHMKLDCCYMKPC